MQPNITHIFVLNTYESELINLIQSDHNVIIASKDKNYEQLSKFNNLIFYDIKNEDNDVYIFESLVDLVKTQSFVIYWNCIPVHLIEKIDIDRYVCEWEKSSFIFGCNKNVYCHLQRTNGLVSLYLLPQILQLKCEIASLQKNFALIKDVIQEYDIEEQTFNDILYHKLKYETLYKKELNYNIPVKYDEFKKLDIEAYKIVNMFLNSNVINDDSKLTNIDNIKNDLCVIIIPIYKQFDQLSPFELKSLKQVNNILGSNYDIVIITYNEIFMSGEYNDYCSKYLIVDRKWLTNQKSYSDLCETEIIYKHFLNYTFLLCYQLDAYVFNDQLAYFCNLDYDYIGSPHYIVHENKWKVGNGGFSLRKVETFYKLSSYFDNSKFNDILLEDRYWSENLEKYLKIAPLDIAFTFSHIQYSINDLCGTGMNYVMKIKPFGFHGISNSISYLCDDICSSNDIIIQENINVHLHVICWNERKIFPYMIKYWKEYATHVYLYDMGSNDGLIEYIKENYNDYITIIPILTNKFDDHLNMMIKNNYWKISKGNADFVVVCDFDEVLYAQNIKQKLQYMKNNNLTICFPQIYNLFNLKFEYSPSYYLHNQVDGARFEPSLGKCILFDPNKIEEINYTPGAHNCDPIGEVNWYEEKDIYMFHCKYLGVDYVDERNSELRERIKEMYVKFNYGCQYFRSKNEIEADMTSIIMENPSIFKIQGEA